MVKLHNYMETAVYEVFDRIKGNLDCCTCEECRYDILAMALNNLPPKYVVTHSGQLYTRVNNMAQQFEVDILSAIMNAVQVVKVRPRHNKKD